MENPFSVPLDNRSRNQPSEARSKSENKSMKMGWRCKNAGAMVSSASLQHKHFCEQGEIHDNGCNHWRRAGRLAGSLFFGAEMSVGL